MELELVIFDMDGLMFDTEQIAYKSWYEALKKYGYSLNEEVFVKMIGCSIEKDREILVENFGDIPFQDILSYRYKYADKYIDDYGIPVKDGLYELLGYIDGTDLKKAVATSTKRENALKLINGANIFNKFDYIICGDEVQKPKPEPDIFLNVANKLDCKPEKCMVLEDSPLGIMATYKANMIPVMIPDMKKPDEEIEKLLFKKLDNLLQVIDVIFKLL